MPFINTSVPNLIQGVSQQPDATRFDGQCEEQENALSSVADGLKKRPNTRHVARLLQTAIDANSFVHFINRSHTERYVLIHDGTRLRAFNILTGAAATINGSTSGILVSSTYLDVIGPREALKALTVSDTTIILNTKETVTKSTIKTPAHNKQAVVTILQGGYEKDYTVSIDIREKGEVSSIPQYVAPVFSFDTTSYVYHQFQYLDTGTWRLWDIYYHRHRVTGINIVSGGQNVPDDFNIYLTPSNPLRGNARFSFTVTNGVVTGATITNQGNYDGTTSVAPTGTQRHYYTTPPTFIVNAWNVPEATLITKSATYRSSGSNSSTHANSNTIANGLKSKLVEEGIDDYFYISRSGSSIFLTLTHGNDIENKEYDFTIQSSDSLGDSGMAAVYKSTSSIHNLPQKNLEGFATKIVGDAELSQDDYYVKFETDSQSNIGTGSYVETVAPDIVKGLDASTMPHVLVNSGVNEFTFKEANYTDRLAGDDDTNPLPSFVNQTIDGMFFFKNRLGFLSGENVIMTESGLGSVTESGEVEYNLGRTTVTSLLDSAPIDISVSSSRVTDLQAAKGFQENLMLFSNNGQFVLKGGDVLTPKSVSVTPVTNFNFESAVEPIPLGSYLYFPFTRGEFIGLREYTVNAASDTYDATEVTEHIPAYIPKNIIDIAGTTSEDMIAILSLEDKTSLYIYKYFWSNNQKVLSSWSKFTFTGELRGVEFIESTLYAIITHNGETNLVEMSLASGLSDAAGYVTHLDNRVADTVTNGSSTITLPYTPEDNSVEVYTTDGLKLNCTNSGATVTLAQAVSGNTDVWVGIPYTMKYTFSEQLFKAKAGNGKSPSNAAKMRIRNGSLYYADSAYFKVKVTPKYRDTYENVFTPDVVGSSTIGSLTLGSGFYRFPVFTKPLDTTITIENESALPSTFQSAEFESFVHSRSNRYG